MISNNVINIISGDSIVLYSQDIFYLHYNWYKICINYRKYSLSPRGSYKLDVIFHFY